MPVTSKLAIGPMSKEIVEAAFRCSSNPVMLIASKNQVDYAGGYVNNWTTASYCEYVKEMRRKYGTPVLLCRDHCGPGFNGRMDLEDSYNTVRRDIENGFDLIHFDLCHHGGDKFGEARNLIEFALSLNSDIFIEVGTDDNTGDAKSRLGSLGDDIESFLSFCRPEFYVVQTGSLVMGTGQAGVFDAEVVRRSSDVIHSYGLKLKEHNADYLPRGQILSRAGLVDAVNIAPQLGVVQTLYTLTQAAVFGADPRPFLERCYESRKWEKWFSGEVGDKCHRAVACGHYNFTSPEYVKLYTELSDVFDLRDGIVGEVVKIIDMYSGALNHADDK